MEKQILNEVSRMGSIDDIQDIIGHKVNFILYDDLANINNINELFNESYGNICVILVRTSKNQGHWILLTKVDKTITLFNSYGLFVDKDLDYTAVDYYPYLSKLMFEYNGPLEYSDYQLQQFKNYEGVSVSTCWRWVAYYAIHKIIPIDDFNDIFKKNKKYINLDLLITFLTSPFLLE